MASLFPSRDEQNQLSVALLADARVMGHRPLPRPQFLRTKTKFVPPLFRRPKTHVLRLAIRGGRSAAMAGFGG